MRDLMLQKGGYSYCIRDHACWRSTILSVANRQLGPKKWYNLKSQSARADRARRYAARQIIWRGIAPQGIVLQNISVKMALMNQLPGSFTVVSSQ